MDRLALSLTHTYIFVNIFAQDWSISSATLNERSKQTGNKRKLEYVLFFVIGRCYYSITNISAVFPSL